MEWLNLERCPVLHELGTFSIVARDSKTGEFGVGSATAAPCVGALLPFAEAGVGAIATQAWVNVNLGYKGLALVRAGMSVGAALEGLLSDDPGRSRRQVIGIDARGCYGYTGEDCTQEKAHLLYDEFAVAGNILTDKAVLTHMAEAFTRSRGDLAEKILAAVRAGERAGGDRRGKMSAVLLVASKKPKLYHNLRIDMSKDPVADLVSLYRACRKMQDEMGDEEDDEILAKE